jgi:hypothetical protein
MSPTVSETALERKLKMHLPANNLQKLTHSAKISCFRQSCRRDTEICARYGYVDINRFIKKLLRLALETAMIKAVSTFDLLSHVEMEACQQPLPECEWK